MFENPSDATISKFWEQVIAQALALIGFFAFPALQYGLLKRFSRKEGNPQLWFLPPFGFRLVIHNISRRRTLKELKYRAFIRKVVEREDVSVKTWLDDIIQSGESFFLFPENDQTLLSFRLQHTVDGVEFLHTDKLGTTLRVIPVSDFNFLICDYSATVQNFFNFNIQVAKRVELSSESLLVLCERTRDLETETEFGFDRIRSVG